MSASTRLRTDSPAPGEPNDAAPPPRDGLRCGPDDRRRAGVVVGVVFLALLPLLNISLPGILPGAHLHAGRAAADGPVHADGRGRPDYHMLLGVAGLLSFGHALYFGAGVYGLGIIARALGMPLLPAMGLDPAGGDRARPRDRRGQPCACPASRSPW